MKPGMRTWRWWRRSLAGNTPLPSFGTVMSVVVAAAAAFLLLADVVLRIGHDARLIPVGFAVAALGFLVFLALGIARQRRRRTTSPPPSLDAVGVTGLMLFAPFYLHLLRGLPSGIATGVIARIPSAIRVCGELGMIVTAMAEARRITRPAL